MAYEDSLTNDRRRRHRQLLSEECWRTKRETHFDAWEWGCFGFGRTVVALGFLTLWQKSQSEALLAWQVKLGRVGSVLLGHYLQLQSEGSRYPRNRPIWPSMAITTATVILQLKRVELCPASLHDGTDDLQSLQELPCFQQYLGWTYLAPTYLDSMPPQYFQSWDSSNSYSESS